MALDSRKRLRSRSVDISRGSLPLKAAKTTPLVTAVDLKQPLPGEPKSSCYLENKLTISQTDPPPRKSPIANLSNEIILRILRTASGTSSVCFGLTCKRIYELHRSIHPRPALLVPHKLRTNLASPEQEAYPWLEMERKLVHHLEAWMAGAGLVYDYTGGKFVTYERKAELDKMRETDTSYEWGIWI